MQDIFSKIFNWFKKHWLGTTIGVVAFVIFANTLYLPLLFGFISYIDRHAYDTDYSKLPKPYSQRGEPLPPTDVPVTLPPDPGEAGKATLEGIDSNNDGVRDDLEREIVYMYPQNEEVRRVLRAMVKTGQQVITTDGDHEYFMNLKIKYLALMNCHSQLVPNLNNMSNTRLNSNNAMMLNWVLQNTKKRKQIFEDNSAKATPFAGPPIGGDMCALVKGQY